MSEDPRIGAAGAAGSSTPERGENEVTLLFMAAALLQGRRIIVGLAFVFAILTFLFVKVSPKQYVADVAFVPQQGGSKLSGLASSLAGQLGISVPSSDETQGADFYQQLILARVILSSVAGRKYQVDTTSAGRDSVQLVDLLKISAPTPEGRDALGIKWLQGAVVPTVNEQTGVVTVTVTTHWPLVSYQIASALLADVEDFNLRTRRTQAQAEREFLEGRVAAAHTQLTDAETGLQTFLQRNRQYENSPELTFEHDRLNRRVTMQQELYTGLAQSYEQARIKEVQNTPVITVLEPPIVPPIPQPGRLILKVLLGTIFGGLVGVGLVVVGRSTQGRRDAEAEALHEAWADTKHDLVRLIPRRRKD